MKRRTFLQSVALGASVVGQGVCRPETTSAGDQQADVAGMPRRVLGRTGVQVSIIAYPGFALREGTQEECTTSLAKALEQGVNFFDVAPAYADGTCEQRMGEGFSRIGGYRRDQIVLACKTNKRTKGEAQQELEQSLRRLKTDYFDLYQLHCLIKPDDDVDRAFAADGVMEVVLKAREEGKIRHIGFSAHTTVAALAALQKFPFDTVMFPINYVEMFTFGFGRQVLDLAVEQGAAVLAIKPMSGGDWPEEFQGSGASKRPRNWWYRTLESPVDIDLALRFTLSQKGVVAGIPPAWLELADRAIQVGKNYRPLTEDDTEKLRAMAAASISVFQPRQQIARHGWRDMRRFDGPHEGCPGRMTS